jgi:STE24 endopeptidase
VAIAHLRQGAADATRLGKDGDGMRIRNLMILTALFFATDSEMFAQAKTPGTSATEVSVTELSEEATRAYLDRVPPEQKKRSDDYYEGGYWLQLWDFLLGLAVAWVLLQFRISAWLRDRVNKVTRVAAVHRFLYWCAYFLITTALLFPFILYRGYFREHQYGLSNQTLGGWLGDFLKGLLLGLIFGGFLVVILYAVIRRAPRTWWVWGAMTMVVFLAFVIMISPIYINPLFNKYTRLEDPRVKEPILRMAHANGVAVDDVWVMDASRQTKRISANVSGFLGTERITLNDNLLNRTSLPEIEAVMGHELGHYVLNHIYELLILFGLVIVAGFLFVQWAFGRITRRHGERWGITGVDDPAGFPLLVALFTSFMFVFTPVNNSIVRVQETEADMFGLNAARQPDGFAEVALKLGEYRKLDPGPIEEVIFYDHPSGRSRIYMAMRWKAAQAAPMR